MEFRDRTEKLLVVTDERGTILSGMWPGLESEGAPTGMWVRLASGQVAHEVNIPTELREADQPDLSLYRVELRGDSATLTRLDDR